jgi:DNA-binding NtrC family response regulator
VLQERSFEPVGSSATKTVDSRVILASNVDLHQLVADQKFRQDLFYRINVITIRMPALRERLGDIALLANHFLRLHSKEVGREILGFTQPAMSALQRYVWPGNVRELENAVERAVVLCRRPQIDVEDLGEQIGTETQGQEPSGRCAGANGNGNGYAADDFASSAMPLEQALEIPERRIIESALKRNAWNRQATAAELDINRTTLYKKMRKYRLDVGESN